MKYGVWNMDQETQNGYKIVNIGSVAMRIAMEDLLVEMGVDRSEIVHISKDTWNCYDGDYLIVPVNGHHMQDAGNKELLGMSQKIIPIFLSVSLNDINLSREQIDYFKKYQPIGCRDYRTMNALRMQGIDSYVNGCIAGTFTKRKEGEYKKIFFVDVPYGVMKYVPKSMYGDIEFINHELKVSDLPNGMDSESYTRSIIEKYKNEAKLVVTSRFHGAIIPWSLGVPVIVVNENYTFRFSWVKKLFPFYTKENFDSINWNPQYIDNTYYFNQTKKIAKQRILDTTNKYKDILEMSSYLENREDVDGLIDYYDEALNFIDNHFKRSDAFRYCFWGVNNNARAIYDYIKLNYPNAKLVHVYDSFKKIEFEGMSSLHPNKIKTDDDLFIFVTTFVAGYVAEDYFREKGIGKNRYFICKRRYITKEDLI